MVLLVVVALRILILILLLIKLTLNVFGFFKILFTSEVKHS